MLWLDRMAGHFYGVRHLADTVNPKRAVCRCRPLRLISKLGRYTGGEAKNTIFDSIILFVYSAGDPKLVAMYLELWELSQTVM
ncbi:hypothetical protein C475_22244 [Halosimplex carlsbadense 2-9-1]|uniref:Uncharacterized protein n=1 Tax=Halosimplex carlsbadense 2-9-1 TaxID=797114 RepID=M0CBI2_9EURY|nr:hypothetical protein C475_22244 [Halosimplex carlsbadense 2-9-1]